MDSDGGRSPHLRLELARPSIHDLPVELLSHILSLYVLEYSSSLIQVQTLCLVCSKWRDVVEGTPALWCRLTGEDPLQGVKKALRCSQNYPLDVVYRYTDHRKRSAADEFLPTVSLQAWRWRRAFIYVYGDRKSENLLHGLTVGKSSRLESLNIAVDGSIKAPLTLFEGAALPSLRRLRLRNAPLVWNGEQLFNLQTLEVLAERHLSSPRLDGVISVLQMTQGLKIFTCIGSLFQAPNGGNTTVSQHPLLLPALERLHINSFETSGWLDLFRIIRAPACRHVSLEGSFTEILEDPGTLAEIAERLSQLTPSVQTVSDRKERVRITLKSEEVRFRWSSLNLVFWHFTKTVQVANWMIFNLVDERAKIRLDVTEPMFNAHELEMLDPLTSRRTISKLDLSRATRPPRAILEYLSKPNPSPDGRLRWLWPDLTAIAVPARVNDLPLILRMLRGRAQAIDLPGSVRPQSISKLCLVEYETYSLDTTKVFTKIVQVMTANGGSLTIADWGEVKF